MTKSLLVISLLHTGGALLSGTLYVDIESQNPQPPFSTWETAATDIQSAVDEAANFDVIRVRPGTYTAQANSKDRRGGPTVVDTGGLFISIIGETGNRDDVIIDGEGQYRGMLCMPQGASSGNPPVSLQNLTIRNGINTDTDSRPDYGGGGLTLFGGRDNDDSVLDIINCAFVSNRATRCGGGISASRGFAARCGLSVSDSIFIGNEVTKLLPLTPGNSGGAVSFNLAYKADFTNCQFIENQAAVSGGAIYAPQPGFDMAVRNSEFRRNKVLEWQDINSGGSCIHMNRSQILDIRNSLFADNYAYERSNRRGGSAILTYGAVAGERYEIRNCTFYGNFESGAIHQKNHEEWSPCKIWNSIFYNNGPYDINIQESEKFTNYFYNCSFTDTDFEFNVVMDNVITGDPLFIDAEGGDFRLSSISPCINAGVNEVWMSGAYDLDGRPRIALNTVDMGAYEYVPQGALLLVR